MTKKNKSQRPIRNLVERVLNTFLRSGRLARFSYRLGAMGHARVTRHEVVLAPGQALPRPLKIAFASDFHAGPTTAPALFDELLALVEAERPDVLLLGGDYVVFDAANVAALDGFLAALRIPLRTYAVLGNHDVWNGRRTIVAALEAHGVAILDNLNHRLPAPFGMVSVCGIDDPWTGTPRPADAFAGAAPVRLFVTHAPDGLFLLDGQRYDVAFSGHTHGGQIATPGGRPLFRPSGPVSREHTYGRYEVEGNGPMFVSRGVGCSGIPLRVNADPELLVCTLRAV